MTRNEALKILGLNDTASDEDAKKKYRELTKKYHPDINKEADAEDNFKRINAAYAAIQNPTSEPKASAWETVVDFEDILRNMQDMHSFRREQFRFPRLEISIAISFEESIKGCEKEISFNRNEMCTSCQGIGANFTQRVTTCTTCNGKGQIAYEQGKVRFIRTCPTCFGQNKIKTPCNSCNSMGGKSINRTYRVAIPQGVENGSVLRLAQMGHFTSSGFGSNHEDAYLKVSVNADPIMKLDGDDVISIIKVSLLDCLQGTSRKENTVHGEIDVVVPPGTKNKDAISIPNYGVRDRKGAHKFIIDTVYPDTSRLIEFLKTMENKCHS